MTSISRLFGADVTRDHSLHTIAQRVRAAADVVESVPLKARELY